MLSKLQDRMSRNLEVMSKNIIQHYSSMIINCFHLICGIRHSFSSRISFGICNAQTSLRAREPLTSYFIKAENLTAHAPNSGKNDGQLSSFIK